LHKTKPMNKLETDYTTKRIIDFNPGFCTIEDDCISIESAMGLMEGNNLFLPEKVRMPDGTLKENIDFYPLKMSLCSRKDGPITMYIGNNFARIVYNWEVGNNRDVDKNSYLHYPCVTNICLYDDVMEFSSDKGESIKITSTNGILYCNDKIVFIPDNNSYAESLPLEPTKIDKQDNEIDLDLLCPEGYGRDAFGGLYSLDGKRFLRYTGHSLIHSYHIREGVEEICDRAFAYMDESWGGCRASSLHQVIMPDSLKYIGREAFRNCNIWDIRIPEGVVEIDDEAFDNNQNTESVTLPSTLQRIGNSAFCTCGMKSLFIPKSVKNIGEDAFTNCYRLTSIEVEEGNPSYSSDNGVLFDYDKKSLICLPPLLFPDSPDNTNEKDDTEEYIWCDYYCESDGVAHFASLDDEQTHIHVVDEETGEEYNEITGWQVGFGVGDIITRSLDRGDKVYVEDGEQVKVGQKLYSHKTFNEDWRPCYGSSRKCYSVPESVTHICTHALKRNTIKVLNIPKTVQYIGDEAFVWSRMDEIVVSQDNLHYETRNNVLIDKTENAVLLQFGKSKEIEFPDGVEVIKSGAYGNKRKSPLVIPEGVKYIENGAFDFIRTDILQLPSTLCYVAPNAFSSIIETNIQNSEGEFRIIVPKGLKRKYLELLKDSYSYLNKYIIEEKSDVLPDIYDNSLLSAQAIVTEEKLDNSVVDEYGVRYSKDGKLLLSFGDNPKDTLYYHVKEGTVVICDDTRSLNFYSLHLPSSIRYVGKNSIGAVKLIIEGTDVCFADNFSNLTPNDFIYVPCGSWADYHKKLEIVKRNQETEEEDDDHHSDDEDDENVDNYDLDDDSYHLIELSKASILHQLRMQQSLFRQILEQRQGVISINSTNLDGSDPRIIYSYKSKNHLLFFNDTKTSYMKYAPCLSSLGYALNDITKILGVQVDRIEISDLDIGSVIGRKLAGRIIHSFTEDFVNEETYEIISLPFRSLLVPAGYEIDKKIMDVIKEYKIQHVYVYHDDYDYYHDYTQFIKYCVDEEPDERKKTFSPIAKNFENVQKEADLEMLLEMLPYKKPEEITDSDKEELASVIVKLIKGAMDHSGYYDYVNPAIYISRKEAVHEMTDEDRHLSKLINGFYECKINEIKGCKTDTEIICRFKDNTEIRSEQRSFLEQNGIPNHMISVLSEELLWHMDRYNSLLD